MTTEPEPSLVDRLLGAIGLRRASTPGPGESATPVIPGTFTHYDLALLRAIVDEHDRGIFVRSALLAEHVRRDPDLSAALTQRLDGLFGLPCEVVPLDDSEAAKAEAARVQAQWPTIASVPAQREVVSSAVLLGFGVGQLVWEPDETGELVERLLPWPSGCVEYREAERRWYALTTAGPVPIVHGTGAWVLYAPRSVNRPFTWGALRALAEWFFRAQDGAAGASRHAEVHGLPVWLARLPSGSETSEAGKRFLRSIKNMGRNAVVPLPQSDTKGQSYELALESASTDAHRIFEFLLRNAAGKFRLVILGQDLTSQNQVVGTNASSQTGADTLSSIWRADAQSWGECCTQQIARPLAVYRGTPAVKVCIDAEPDEDFGALATALKTAGEAAKAWNDAGWEVDLPKYAERFGVPGKLKPKAAEPPPQSTNPPPAQGDPEPAEGDDEGDDA